MSNEYDDSALRREMDLLRRRVDDLLNVQVAISQLHNDLERAGSEIAALGKRLERLRDTVERLDEQRRRENQLALQRVDAQLLWLQRRARFVDGDDEAPLDPSPEQIALARSAERGRVCEAQLLEPDERTARQALVLAWSAWQERHLEQRAIAVTTSRTIATTAPSGPDRGDAAGRFRAARDELEMLWAGRNATRQKAAKALKQLERDDELKASFAQQISDGRTAHHRLMTELEAQLCEVVDRAALLPGWFVGGLGSFPLFDTEGWIRAGAELLAYRATFAIDDRHRALGPEPDASFSDRRRRWHGRLNETFRVFR